MGLHFRSKNRIRRWDARGPPWTTLSLPVTRTAVVQRRGPGGAVVAEAITVTAVIEVWLYDFGPRRFMEELSFENGRLIAIESLGYGTPQGRTARSSERRIPRMAIVSRSKSDTRPR